MGRLRGHSQDGGAELTHLNAHAVHFVQEGDDETVEIPQIQHKDPESHKGHHAQGHGSSLLWPHNDSGCQPWLPWGITLRAFETHTESQNLPSYPKSGNLSIGFPWEFLPWLSILEIQE